VLVGVLALQGDFEAHGKVLRGPGVLRCTPLGTNRTQVVWHEWFHLPAGVAGKAAWPVLSMRRVNDRSQIYPVFHDLFQRRTAETRSG